MNQLTSWTWIIFIRKCSIHVEIGHPRYLEVKVGDFEKKKKVGYLLMSLGKSSKTGVSLCSETFALTSLASSLTNQINKL